MIDYYSRQEISNSKLSEFKKSPLHYDYFMRNVSVETPAMLLGTAAHTILFEPNKLEKKFFTLDKSKGPDPDSTWGSKENRLYKRGLIAHNAGRQPLDVDDFNTVVAMRDELMKHEVARELIEGCAGNFEEEIFFKDPTFGLACKAKLDGRSKGKYILDYKTTVNADPRTFQKDAWNKDYFRQASFYCDGTGEKEFYFIAQEKVPPYAISIHKCTQELLDYGRNEYNYLLLRMKACIENNLWPGYEIKNNIDNQNYFDFDIPDWKIQTM